MKDRILANDNFLLYWAVAQDQLLMLLMYAKNTQDDLTKEQLKLLREIVEADYP